MKGTNGTDWGRVTHQFSTTGQGWTVAYQPLPAPVSKLSYEFTASVSSASTAGKPNVLAFMEPSFVFGESGLQIGFFTDFVFKENTDGKSLASESHKRAGISIGGDTLVGFAWAAIASGPLDLKVELIIGEGGADTSPAFEIKGTDPQLLVGGTRLGGLPNGPAGSIKLDATVATEGWSHFHVIYDPVQPIGVRQQHVEFPNGYTDDDLGVGHGYWVVVLGSSSRSGKMDFWGTFDDKPGSFRSEVSYAEVDSALDAAFFHLPIPKGSLPPEFQGNYSGWSDPFPEGPPLAFPASGVAAMRRPEGSSLQ